MRSTLSHPFSCRCQGPASPCLLCGAPGHDFFHGGPFWVCRACQRCSWASLRARGAVMLGGLPDGGYIEWASEGFDAPVSDPRRPTQSRALYAQKVEPPNSGRSAKILQFRPRNQN